MKRILLALLLVTVLILSVSACNTEATYTVTFDADGGSAVASQVVQEGGKAISPTTPTKEGYTFAGWFVGETAYNFDAAVTANVALKAKWTLNTYTVTFDADNGTENTTATVEHGKTVAAPAAPTKAGYTFAGWFVGEAAYDFKAAVTADVTVKAAWTVNQYTITFDTDGGSEIAPIVQDFGTAVTAPAAPEKVGYTFKGWDKEIPATMPVEGVVIKAIWEVNQYTITFDTVDGSEIAAITLDFGAAITAPADPTKTGYTFGGWDNEIPATMPAENMTITAKWTINQYTITFDTVDGSEIAAITLDFGAAITAPADPTKTGYTFGGWDNEIPATMPAENMTITAKWTINQYTIAFDTDGGSEIAPIVQDFGTAIVAPADPTKEGYTFADWDKAIPATMPAENMTITASWTVNQYTITFNTNGGNKIDAITLDFGAAVTAPADPTKAGHTFDGWDKTIPATMPAEDITITASWIINTYKVTFDADNGDALVVVEVNYDELVNAPADPEKEGYNFAGWYLGDKAFNIEAPITESVNLKAHWTINHYSVIIDPDNGTDYDADLVEYGTIITNPGTPVKEGYTFKGWFVGENEYDFSAPITGNTTIVAKWTINQYTITFNTNGGSTIAAITLDYGTDVTAPADPTKTGYTFGGWDKEIPETMPAEDMTITASWTINKYTITFNTVGGNEIAAITLDFGATVTAPADPTKTGYTFGGWDKEIPETMPAEDMTITASWTINKYTITFNTVGGNEIAAITLDFGATVTAPADPTKKGFAFTGWDKEIPATMPAENVTITATWELDLPDLTAIAGTWTGEETNYPVIYSYTFVIAADGTITAEYQNAGYGNVPVTINYVLFENNVLTINYTAGSVEGADLVFTLSEDKGILTTATGMLGIGFELKKTYTVTFDWGEYNKASETESVQYGKTVKEKTSTSYTGHTLIGWFDENGNKFDFSTPITSDMTLTAKWEVKKLTLTFYGQNGTTVVKTMEVTYNTVWKDIADLLPTEIPTTDGYKFNGEWYGSLTTTSPISATAKITSDKQYYPGLIAPMNDIEGTWTGTDSKNNAFTMEVDAATQTVTITVVNGAEITEYKVASVYYKDFSGTFKMAVRYTIGDSTTKTTLTLTAQADGTFKGSSNSLILKKEGAKTYTVTFDSNGGSAVDAQTIAKDATAQKPEDPTKDGFTFAGWYNGETLYDFATPVTGDITLTAKWEEAAAIYTVTFTNGSTTTTQEVVAGQYAEAPADPSKSGKKFMGWFDGETKFDATTPINGNFEFVAKWGVEVTIYKQRKDGKDEIVKTLIVEDGTVIPAEEIPAAEVNEGFVFTGVWHKSYTVSAAPVDITAPVTEATKLYPGVIKESITVLDGTWTGKKENSDGTVNVYTFTIDVAVDENGKVTGATVTVAVDGTSIDVASIQYNKSSTTSTYTQLAIKYYKSGSSSASTYAVNYYDDGTVKLGTPSITLEKVLPSYTVTFDSAGGSAVDAQTVKEGSVATAPEAPTRDKYLFKGWLLNGEVYDFATPVTGDITLAANWVASKTLTFVKQDGTKIVYNGEYGKTIGEIIDENYEAIMAAIKGVEVDTIIRPATFDEMKLNLVNELRTTDGSYYTGKWMKGNTSTTEANFSDTLTGSYNISPSFIAPIIKDFEGTWKCTYNSKEYQFTVNVITDDNGNIIDVTAEAKIDGVAQEVVFVKTHVLSGVDNIVIRYQKAGSTSLASFTIKQIITDSATSAYVWQYSNTPLVQEQA